MSVKFARRERGDTLVEVLLALAIVSVIAVGAVVLMNRGLNTALNSLEYTQARNGIVRQAELLQYIRDSYARADDSSKNQYPANLWTTIRGLSVNNANGNACTPVEPDSFYIDASDVNNVRVLDYTGVQSTTFATPGRGMWIDAVFVDSEVDFMDFYIKSCWDPVNNGPKVQANSVVRLYDVN